MCLLVLVTAGLFVRTLWNLRQLDLGFAPGQVLVGTVQFPRGYTSARWAHLLESLRERATVLPGVRVAAYSHVGLLSGFGINFNVDAEGQPSSRKDYPETYEMRVSPGFFTTMGTPLLEGRDFTNRDDANSPQVAIVNEAFAREFFPGNSPLRRRFGVDGPASSRSIEVVGVVKDTKLTSLRATSPNVYYRPARQRPVPAATFAVRTTGGLDTLTSALLGVAKDVDPRATIKDPVPFTKLVDRTLLVERLAAQVSSALGLLALLVASIGLYGLVAFAVARRTREIGIRMAVGASGAAVQWMVLRESLAVLGLGLALGVPAALAATRPVASMLFGLSPADPATVMATAVVLVTITLAASYFPARRATRIDPVEALRNE